MRGGVDEWVADTTEFDNVDSLKKELVINIENVKNSGMPIL